jgi:hypothetical protein
MGTQHQADELQAKELADELAFEAYLEQLLIEKYGVNHE